IDRRVHAPIPSYPCIPESPCTKSTDYSGPGPLESPAPPHSAPLLPPAPRRRPAPTHSLGPLGYQLPELLTRPALSTGRSTGCRSPTAPAQFPQSLWHQLRYFSLLQASNGPQPLDFP